MNMPYPTPTIQTISKKYLVGLSLEMSFADNLTGQLWSQFMPRIGEIGNRTDSNKISMQIYPSSHFQNFNPADKFVKWATVEVANFDDVPKSMKSFELPGGLYALFHYKGSSADNNIFQYIFAQWLPTSDYKLDDRPHFELLGDKYKNNDPSSEEIIHIPVKRK